MEKKTLKFLVDESTGAKTAQALAQDGYDVEYVADTMQGAEDPEILNKAFSEARILVTNDKDFGERVYRRRESHAGVILLRLKEDMPANRIAVLKKVIADFGEVLKDRFTVATESKVRIRKPR